MWLVLYSQGHMLATYLRYSTLLTGMLYLCVAKSYTQEKSAVGRARVLMNSVASSLQTQ